MMMENRVFWPERLLLGSRSIQFLWIRAEAKWFLIAGDSALSRFLVDALEKKGISFVCVGLMFGA